MFLEDIKLKVSQKLERNEMKVDYNKLKDYAYSHYEFFGNPVILWNYEIDLIMQMVARELNVHYNIQQGCFEI